MNRWGTGLVASALAMSTPAVAASATTQRLTGAPVVHCAAWHLHTIKSGLGILESILPDNHGGMLLSSSTGDAVERLSRNGTVTKIVSAASPGQLVRHGKRVFVPTGDAAESGALSRADGTIELLNPKTGKVAPYATGLTMPNGLAIAPNGDGFVTRDVGTGTGITRIAAAGAHNVTTQWAKVSDTNGIAINRSTKMMYVDRTFSENAAIIQIPLHHPGRPREIGNLTGLGSAVPKGLDDLIMGPHGVLYLPGNASGEVFSFDPATRQACLIASGLQDPSAIAVGTGHGWRKGSLFVCGFDGTVRELDPPT